MTWVHIGLKDLRITSRDRGALGVLLGMPMLLIVILGSALGNLAANIEKTPIAVVNLDKGSVGAEVTDGFFDDPDLSRLFLARRTTDIDEARAAVERGDLAGALVVPPDFTRRLDTGKPSKLTIYTDPGRQIAGAVFRSVAEAVSTHVSAASVAARTSAYYAAGARTNDPSFIRGVVAKAVDSATETGSLEAVRVDETTAARGTEIPMLAYYAGAMSVMFMMFGSMFGAFSLLRERDTWTLPRMLTTPVPRSEIVGGKMLGVFTVGLAQFAVLYLFTNAIGVRWGDPFAVAILSVSTVAAATGLSLLIASAAKTVRSVSGIAQIAIQLMAALGGSFIPVAQFPEWMHPLHYLTVNGWAIDGILETMRGGSILTALPNAGVLLLMGAAFYAAGAMRLRWE